jgi:glutamate--cysteine ligase
VADSVAPIPASVVSALRSARGRARGKAPDNATEAGAALLSGITRGIEKESLRVTKDGALSSRPHPKALGSALTHPNITTDFSEAQPELISDVHASPEAAIKQLQDVHRFVYQSLDNELLWTASMPCVLGAQEDIPVGRYGSSNIATAKTVYRLGLGNRYGRLMQTISGIHYNFSVPEAFWPVLAGLRGAQPDRDFQTDAYFGLIRNFRRYSWLLIYLFGASPAICKSFVKNQPHQLEQFDEGSLFLPHATSLRMGRLGYQSDAQSDLHISYNSLAQYAASMQTAVTQPYPPYEDIGVKVEGEYRQLNAALLQIENEFYGTIRPKRRIDSGERPLTALRARGVEYVEVRCLDLNPFLPVGIDELQIRFLDVFLLYCLVADSPPDSQPESELMGRNQLAIVERGRAPGLSLHNGKDSVSRDEWAAEILAECQVLAELFDQATDSDLYSYALAEQATKVKDPALTPSARMLAIMGEQGIPFFRFAMNQSIAHKGYFDEHPLRGVELAEYQATSATSLEKQRAIEDADNIDFDTFLETYLALP